MRSHPSIPTIVLVAIAVITCALIPSAHASGDVWEVTLRNGTRLEGTLLRVTPGLYILQTDTGLYELSDDDIDPQTFAHRPRSEAQPKQQLSVTNHYVELHYDGTATRYITFFSQNKSNRVITDYRFGLAPWEQREIDQRALYDGYGTLMPLSFDPPREEWKATWDRNVKVMAELPIPVAPGEFWTVATRATARIRYEDVEDGYAWTHEGDYPEDRVVWLKVRLPQAARLVRTSPEPSAIFEDGGFTYVMWRQFYRKSERRALQLVFDQE